MPDFLETKRQEITARIAEIEPLIDELARLKAALKALGTVSSSAAPSASAVDGRRGPGRPRGSRTARPRTRAAGSSSGRPARARRPGRRRGTGKRAVEAFSLIQQQPGVTTAELANRMGIKPNYLYRVLPGLQQEGKIKKVGRGWQPAAAASTD